MKYRWLNLYNVTKADLEKSVFKLAELNGVNLEGAFISRRLKRFVKDSDNNQRTPEKGPLYKKKKLDTSGEESDQSEQIPLEMTIEEDNKGCLGGSGDQTTLLSHPLASGRGVNVQYEVKKPARSRHR